MKRWRLSRTVSYTHLDVYKRQSRSLLSSTGSPTVQLPIIRVNCIACLSICTPLIRCGADVYKRQGMPNALLEAVCMLVPVVSTDCPCGGPKEICSNECGLLLSLIHIYGQPEKSLISCGFARLDLFISTCFCLPWCVTASVLSGVNGLDVYKRQFQNTPGYRKNSVEKSCRYL